MNSSKNNANLIVDTLIELTGDPFQTNRVMQTFIEANTNFNRVRFVQGKKTLKEIVLPGNPKGLKIVKL